MLTSVYLAVIHNMVVPMLPVLPLMSTVKRFAEVTTLHGIKDLFSTNNRPIRIIWAILLVATTGVMVYETERIVVTFIEQPIATNIRHQRLTRQNLANIITPFICIADWMSKSRVASANLSEEQVWALDSFSNPQTVAFVNLSRQLNSTMKSHIRWWIKYYQDQMLAHDTTLETYYAPIMKQFPFLLLPNDTHGRFTQPYIIMTDSVCFPIDLDAAADVVGVPIYRRDIDLMQEDTVEYLAHAHARKEITFTFFHGANARYFSEVDRISANFSVDSTPTQLNLRMRFKQLLHLSRRQMPCNEYPKQEKSSKYPVNYARQLCMQHCMDDQIYTKKYGCTFMVAKTEVQKPLDYKIDKKRRRLPLCTAEKFFFSRNFSREDNWRVIGCQDSCENLVAFCSEWDIQNERIRWVPPRTCQKPGCLNLAIVSQPTLEVSEEVLLMTFDTLLSNIGGQAGLWFGGSILSIIQLLFFCFLYGTCRCCERRRKESFRMISSSNNNNNNNNNKKRSSTMEIKDNNANALRDYLLSNNNNQGLVHSSTQTSDLYICANCCSSTSTDCFRSSP